jgi:thioredoxin-related protein
LCAQADSIRDPETNFFHQSFGDLQEEISIAQDEGLFGVMIMFETNDCPWCERMKKTVLNQASVQDYFRERFRILTLNIEGDAPIVDFAGQELTEKEFSLKHNRIRATPAFLFFDQNGERVMRFTGTTKDPQEFLWLAEFVADGHYQNRKFPLFKRQRREALEQQS